MSNQMFTIIGSPKVCISPPPREVLLAYLEGQDTQPLVEYIWHTMKLTCIHWGVRVILHMEVVRDYLGVGEGIYPDSVAIDIEELPMHLRSVVVPSSVVPVPIDLDDYYHEVTSRKELGFTEEDVKNGLYCKGCKYLYRDSGYCTLWGDNTPDLNYGCGFRTVRR